MRHVCALQPGAAQIDAGEARAAQIGAGEIGLMQVRAVELGVAEIAIAQADARFARGLVLVDDEIGIGDDQVALEDAEQRALGAERQPGHGISCDVTRCLSGLVLVVEAKDLLRPAIELLARDGGEEEREYGDEQQHEDRRDEARGMRGRGAHERLHERRLGAHQKHADGDQHGDVGQQRDAVRPGDADVVVGQEHDLDVEQQHDGQHDQRQPRHAVQERAHDAAAVGPGYGLHEKEVVELEPQRMRAFLGGFEKAHRVIELERLAGQQRELRYDAEMHQHEQDRRELEELGELDVHLQDRQRDGRLEQQILVGDAGDSDEQVGHDGEKDQPGGMRRVARMIDRLEQTVRVDLCLPLRRITRHIRHSDDPRLELNVTAPSKTEKVGHRRHPTGEIRTPTITLHSRAPN